MAASKSQKIQADIDKVKAKISEQQARLKELEKNKQEAENSEIVDIVRGMSISLDELPALLQAIRSGAPLGQNVPKLRHGVSAPRRRQLGSGRLPNKHFGKHFCRRTAQKF